MSCYYYLVLLSPNLLQLIYHYSIIHLHCVSKTVSCKAATQECSIQSIVQMHHSCSVNVFNNTSFHKLFISLLKDVCLLVEYASDCLFIVLVPRPVIMEI